MPGSRREPLTRDRTIWRREELQIGSFICALHRAGHLSFVICHLSFVICHLSFVICHLSFVICHLSFVICHLSFDRSCFWGVGCAKSPDFFVANLVPCALRSSSLGGRHALPWRAVTVLFRSEE